MKKKILLSMIWIIALPLIACTNPDHDMDIVKDNENSIEVNVDGKELLNRSEDISDWVVELYGIDDATTIIFNNDVYVAIVLAYDQVYSKELENTIIYQVKEKDTSIDEVKVTNNAKSFSQISEIIFNLLQDESYDSQVNDINKAISRF